MQVNVVTRHAVRNYGSALQAIATSHLLSTRGADVKVVDYRQPGHEDTGWALANQGAGKRLPAPARVAYAALRHPGAVRTGKVFESALSANVALTNRRYSSFEELEASDEFHADALYCAGSDQVWNIDYNVDNRPYYLDFAPKHATKFSLASSIGMSKLPAREEERLVAALNEFEAISVRESEAAEYLKSLGITAAHHVDPTLAVDPGFWRDFAGSKAANRPYLLVYQLNESPNFRAIVDRVSEQLGLEVRRLEYWRGPRSTQHPSLVRPSIREFVGAFKGADFVVTDSFHGTVFSTTFARPFAVVPPPKYSGRIISLLALTNRRDRLTNDVAEADALARDSSPLEAADSLLAAERASVNAYLGTVLGASPAEA